MSRLVSAVLLALAIAAPPLLLIPLEIHSANPYEFSTAIPDLLVPLLLAVMVAVAVFTALTIIVPRRYDAAMTAVLLAMALLVWTQGQLIVPDLGVLDGRRLAGVDHAGLRVLNVLLWIVLPVGCLLARRQIRRWAVPAAVTLLLIQALPAASAALRAPVVQDFHRFALEDRQAYAFSSDRNVIVLVLDAFQADVFGRLLNDEPDLREALSGFTWFRNAVSGYSKTYPSIALILTGRWYDNNEPVQAFIKRSFLERSIPKELRSRGWQVDLLPRLKRIVYPSPEVASNAHVVLPCEDRLADAGRAMDLGLLRASPHPGKGWWLNEYRWRLGAKLPELCPSGGEHAGSHPSDSGEHHALEFLRRAEREVIVDRADPVFRLYHLMIPHAPFMLDESLSQHRLPSSADGYRRHSRAALAVLERFLSVLESRAVLDNSLIMVVSDHGGGEYLESIEAPGMVVADGSSAGIPGRHWASGLPLVLIKPPGARDALRVSDAPVSLADLASTIAGRLRLDAQFPGRDMFAIEASEQRQRRYRFYAFDGWSGEYLPEMIEYSVSGHAWLPGSWEPTGRRLAPSASATTRPHRSYSLGERLTFRPGRVAEAWLVRGWSPPSRLGMAWSRSSHAEIGIPFAEPAMGDLLIRLDFLPYDSGGAVESPRVRLQVNGLLEQEWRDAGRGWRELLVPASVAEHSATLELQFEFPDAAVPADIGTGPDTRLLGMALYGLEIIPATEEQAH